MKNQIKYFLFGILVFLLYFIVIPCILKISLASFLNSSNRYIYSISRSIAEIILFLVLFFIFKKQLIEDLKKFKKDWRKKLDTGFKYYFIGFLIMVTSNLIITLIFGGLATNEEANREFIKNYLFFSIIAMVILGPAVEEIVFRLGFRKAFKKWLPYALFSGLFFGALHVYTAYAGMNLTEILKNWHQALYIIPYSALGISFAKAYYETDNIWTTITIHTLHNAFTIFLILCLSR